MCINTISYKGKNSLRSEPRSNTANIYSWLEKLWISPLQSHSKPCKSRMNNENYSRHSEECLSDLNNSFCRPQKWLFYALDSIVAKVVYRWRRPAGPWLAMKYSNETCFPRWKGIEITIRDKRRPSMHAIWTRTMLCITWIQIWISKYARVRER